MAPMENEMSTMDRLFNKLAKGIVWLVVFGLIGISVWTYGALKYVYSKGERAGFIQKISEKGWLCKTWEGELAMANLPGTMPQIFTFTVHDDAVAQQIVKLAGSRVTIAYEQHRGIPTSCFGETQYFVTQVTPVK